MPIRTCCFIGCGKPAEWEMLPSTAVYEFVDACTDHVGHLLDDAPETRDGGFACAAYDKRYRVTDPEGFAKEIADALNDEDEEGSTPVHKLFDAAINEALNQGAQHADEHPIQEF